VTRRRDARRLAVGIVFEADVSHRDPSEVLAQRIEMGERIPGFTSDLVHGVAEHLDELDRTIGASSEAWTVERMAAVDRAILRSAAFELLYRDDVPPAAVIDEAVAIAGELSTAESGAFVNGVLGRIHRERADTG
jgi:N utilization substance protein B